MDAVASSWGGRTRPADRIVYIQAVLWLSYAQSYQVSITNSISMNMEIDTPRQVSLYLYMYVLQGENSKIDRSTACA